MQKSWLNHLILEEIKTALLKEQQTPPPPTDDDMSTTDMNTDTSSSPSVAMDPSSGGDMGVGGSDTTGPPEAGGADSGGGGGDLGGDALGDDSDGGMGADPGGGGMFGLGGGGGGGGGGFDDAGDGEGIDPDNMPGAEVTPGPEKRPDDPAGAVMDEAEKISGETNDPQQILNAIKSSIQANFGDYRDAWPIVQQLKDTGNRTLLDVAERLSLFITGVLEENPPRTKSKTKVLRQKDYGTFSIRKVVRRKHGFNVPQIQFDVSKSPNRKSWYVGFNTLEQAKKFASRKHPAPPKPADAVFKEVVQGLVQELIWNEPIKVKKFLNQYTGEINNDTDNIVKPVGKLGKFELFEIESSGGIGEFRLILVDTKGKAQGGIYFKGRNKGGYEIGLASISEALRGSGMATQLILKAMQLHPEVPWWSSGVLVTEQGLKMFKRLFETGKVKMWFSLSPKDTAKLVKNPPEEFWTFQPSDRAKTAYGSAKKELYFRLK